MKKYKDLLWGMIMMALVFVLALSLQDRLPQALDVHFSLQHEANGQLDKSLFLYVLPLGALILQFFLYQSSLVKEIEIPFFRLLEHFMLPVLFSLLYSGILFKNIYQNFPLVKLTSLLVGLLFLIVGNYLPKKVEKNQSKLAPRWIAYGFIFFGLLFLVLVFL